jgi:class 3 adenylate cyclase
MDIALQSYLPRLLLDWYQCHSDSACHDITSHTGILLFADASGFTALTRELLKQGAIGAELLTELLNRLFARLESVVEYYDGDILKFSGDAVWCWLPSKTPIIDCHSQILTQLQCFNRDEPLCRKHPINLHAGAESGDFELVTVGRADQRLEFEISGSIAAVVYQACDLAENGHLVIGPEVTGRQRLPHDARELSDGYRLINPVLTEESTTLKTAGQRESAIVSNQNLRFYLPRHLRERLAASDSGASIGSEQRKVTVLFAKLKAHSPQQLQQIFEPLFGVISRYHGSVARLDPFKDGHKLLALFGALSKRIGEKIDALQAAREIAALSDEQYSVSVGLASGTLLCGEVGASSRREYTVMGEAVNMAARLMSKAGSGSILMAQPFYEQVAALCRATPVSLPLKGIGQCVTVYRFESLHTRT